MGRGPRAAFSWAAARSLCSWLPLDFKTGEGQTLERKTGLAGIWSRRGIAGTSSEMESVGSETAYPRDAGIRPQMEGKQLYLTPPPPGHNVGVLWGRDLPSLSLLKLHVCPSLQLGSCEVSLLAQPHPGQLWAS